jgi:hypothetical protein
LSVGKYSNNVRRSTKKKKCDEKFKKKFSQTNKRATQIHRMVERAANNNYTALV